MYIYNYNYYCTYSYSFQSFAIIVIIIIHLIPSWISCHFRQFQVYWCIQYHQHSYRVEGWAGKGYVFTKNREMTSIGAILTSTCHTKQLNPCMAKLISQLCGDSQWQSACQGKMRPFKGYLSACGCQTGFSEKKRPK